MLNAIKKAFLVIFAASLIFTISSCSGSAKEFLPPETVTEQATPKTTITEKATEQDTTLINTILIEASATPLTTVSAPPEPLTEPTPQAIKPKPAMTKQTEIIPEKPPELPKESAPSTTSIQPTAESEDKIVPAKIISHGNKDSVKVALTLDDAWDLDLVRKAIDVLTEKQVKASFFPVGSAIAKGPELWREAVEKGFELGNHTYSHAYVDGLSEKNIKAELDKWQNAVDKALGEHYDTKYFRPPGMHGFTSDVGRKKYGGIITGYGLTTILWGDHVDTYYDIYRKQGTKVDPKMVAEYIAGNCKGGEIILMHFVRPDVEALSMICDKLKEKGLEMVTISELIEN